MEELWSNLLRRAGHDHGPLPQCHPLAQVSDQRRDAEYQIIRPTFLSEDAIHPGLQSQALRLRDDLAGGDDGPDRGEVVEGFGVAVLRAGHLGPLPISRRDVVAHRVAEDVVQRVLGRTQVLRVLADDDAEFAFVVQLLGDGVDVDVLEGAGQSI